MDAQLQAVRGRRLQDAPALLDREHALLAEDVREDRQAAPRDLRDHLLDEQRDVAVSVRALLDRYLVRAHEGGDEGDRMTRSGGADRLQRAQLGLGGEAVA